MRRAKYIIVEAALVFGLLAMACGASEPAKLAVQDGSSEAERFPIQAAETLQRIQTQHELLASADVDSMSPAEQDQRFRIVQNEIAYDMGTVQSMEVPENWIEYRQRLADLLIAEQHIWDHMTLYALSGEEGQRTEARLEAVDIELEAQRLASEVTGLLESQGNELAVLMPNFTLPPAPVVEATSGSETNAPNTVAPYGAPSELTPDASAITIPDLTLTGGVGDIIILRYRDSEKQPAMVAHWSMDVRPGELALVDYPFVSGDNLEMSLFGNRLDLAYMEAPSGERILELKDVLRPWRGNVAATEDGWYRIYMDNTQGDSVKNMHVIITYHDEAPDAVHLPSNQNELKILLPLNQG